MTKAIPFSRANIGKEEIEAVTKVLESGWVTMGEVNTKFEEEFASYVGAKEAISVNSCTSALFLAVASLHLKPEDEIIVPSFTFTATANVVVHAGVKPVFADIKLSDFTLDQLSVDQSVTKHTKAIIPVHYAGNRAVITSDLPIIEDSAHLIPKGGDNESSYARCYSFYATKNMTTGEGGMITTSNVELADWFRKARLHGLSRDAWKRYQASSKWIYEVDFSGFKFNMTDINAALGRVQLTHLDQFEAHRQKVVAHYNKLLGLNNTGTHLYPILMDDREKFFEFAKERGVVCSFHFPALHQQPAFSALPKVHLPVTEFVASRVVTLPLDAVISADEVEYVVSVVKEFARYYNQEKLESLYLK